MTTDMIGSSIGETERRGVAVTVDVLISGTIRLPCGTAVGAHLDLLDRALEADPRLIPEVVEFGPRAATEDSVD